MLEEDEFVKVRLVGSVVHQEVFYDLEPDICSECEEQSCEGVGT